VSCEYAIDANPKANAIKKYFKYFTFYTPNVIKKRNFTLKFKNMSLI